MGLIREKLGKALIRLGARLLQRGHIVFNDGGSILIPAPGQNFQMTTIGLGGGGGSSSGCSSGGVGRGGTGGGVSDHATIRVKFGMTKPEVRRDR